ncbi:MAG TPA: GNAT family N-acetyltransferase [Pseudonocardiaceae bacterium]|nr:GNAT family N-acetyltransferase [Pseudonocardiaceae bacterium]
MSAVEDVVAAEALFDGPAEYAAGFLAKPGHHLLVAYVDGAPVGMVTGVETTHPDKGTEMFLYELAVADEHQSRGIGRALVRELADLARRHGCYGMWVLTDRANKAAMTAYEAAGAADEGDTVMLGWAFD